MNGKFKGLFSPRLLFGITIGFFVGVAASNQIHQFLDLKQEVTLPVEPPIPVVEPVEPTPVPVPPIEVPKDAIKLTQSDFKSLPGWNKDDLTDLDIALSRSCGQILNKDPAQNMGRGHDTIPMTYGDWQDFCHKFLAQPDLKQAELKKFIESELTPFLAANNDQEMGKFTGYFEAELRGSRVQTDIYKYPLFGKPKDLVSVDLGKFSEELKGKHIIGHVGKGQKFEPYYQREMIEAGGLSDQQLEILWIDDAVDVFLLQVQGSGRVLLPDGEVVQVGYAAHNGHGYKSIGRYLIEQGEIEPHAASWNGIRNWIEKNPEKQAHLFAQNPRFVFFRILEGDGPIGSQGVALTAKRSLAVDQRYVPLGSLIWLDTVQPGGSKEALQTLLVAQDTGGAIKGPVRGDFFWGYGDKALAQAGRMNSQGRYFILLPNQLANRLMLDEKREEDVSSEVVPTSPEN